MLNTRSFITPSLRLLIPHPSPFSFVPLPPPHPVSLFSSPIAGSVSPGSSLYAQTRNAAFVSPGNYQFSQFCRRARGEEGRRPPPTSSHLFCSAYLPIRGNLRAAGARFEGDGTRGCLRLADWRLRREIYDLRRIIQ